MKLERGKRTTLVFFAILIVFLLITSAVLVVGVITRVEGEPFNMQLFSAIFVPLGTALVFISSVYFGSNMIKSVGFNISDAIKRKGTEEEEE